MNSLDDYMNYYTNLGSGFVGWVAYLLTNAWTPAFKSLSINLT